MAISLATGASFSPDRLHRYNLWRIWDPRKPRIAWIGLNPSTADELKNDPTVERCQRRSTAYGYGGMVMLNLFAFRATDPHDMRAADDPVGPGNDQAIVRTARRVGAVVCCWGQHGTFRDRARHVLQLLHGIPLLCLGVTSSGAPRHPLYVSYSILPYPYATPAGTAR